MNKVVIRIWPELVYLVQMLALFLLYIYLLIDRGEAPVDLFIIPCVLCLNVILGICKNKFLKIVQVLVYLLYTICFLSFGFMIILVASPSPFIAYSIIVISVINVLAIAFKLIRLLCEI